MLMLGLKEVLLDLNGKFLNKFFKRFGKHQAKVINLCITL